MQIRNGGGACSCPCCRVPLALALAPAEPVTIYVGPQVKDGFVDTDKGVADSIKDVKGQMPTGLRLVQTEAEATLRLYVTRREQYDTGNAVNTGSGTVSQQGQYSGTGVTIAISGMRVRTILRAGSYERSIDGEAGSYKGAAKAVLESVSVWVEANRSRLERATASP